MLLTTADNLIDEWVVVIPATVYGRFEDEVRYPIPRDPDDWHTVALVLALDADIWTGDSNFLGCGIATWTTDTPSAHLAR